MLRHRRILSADGVDYNIAEAPLYFVRSGTVSLGVGKVGVSGRDGYSWTSATNSDKIYDVFRFFFDTKDVYPDSYIQRYYAFPLRCVLEKPDIDDRVLRLLFLNHNYMAGPGPNL